jgi:hypothetical protein
MSRMLRIGSVALAVLAAVTGAAAVSEAREATAGDWSRYQNERFGFRLEYPANLFYVEHSTVAGDGRVFATRDGQARLLVGALGNEDRHSPKSYQDFLARTTYAHYTITDRALGDDWLLLSGEADGKIFYEKATISCGGKLISSFALLYPADQRGAFEPILARVANSFVPSTKTCRGDPRAASSGHRSARLGPQAEASARAPRAVARNPRAARIPGDKPLTPSQGYAPMADRIARVRGTDVIVVLRRTTPPYDYKYVRGYANR